MMMQHIHHLLVYFLSDGAQQATADKTTNTTRSLVLFKPPPAGVPAGQNRQPRHHQVNQTNKQTEHRHLRSTQKKVTRKQAGRHNINDSRPSCCEHVACGAMYSAVHGTRHIQRVGGGIIVTPPDALPSFIPSTTQDSPVSMDTLCKGVGALEVDDPRWDGRLSRSTAF